MSIKVICMRCSRALTKPGAILLSPPMLKSLVKKDHLCSDCYNTFYNYFNALGENK